MKQELKELVITLKKKKIDNIFQNGLIDDYIRQFRLIEKMEKKKFKDEDHSMRLEIEYNDLQQLHEQLYSADIL
jgi:hypothetical protein